LALIGQIDNTAPSFFTKRIFPIDRKLLKVLLLLKSVSGVHSAAHRGNRLAGSCGSSFELAD
jgi:hypothetical protein